MFNTRTCLMGSTAAFQFLPAAYEQASLPDKYTGMILLIVKNSNMLLLTDT